MVVKARVVKAREVKAKVVKVMVVKVTREAKSMKETLVVKPP